MADFERVRSPLSGSTSSQVVSQLCSCGREAAVEKCGRAVCRGCAELLRGREFPVRSGRDRASFGSNTEKQQLDMVDLHGPKRYYGRYLG